jgi:hypothetical protein
MFFMAFMDFELFIIIFMQFRPIYRKSNFSQFEFILLPLIFITFIAFS